MKSAPVRKLMASTTAIGANPLVARALDANAVKSDNTTCEPPSNSTSNETCSCCGSWDAPPPPTNNKRWNRTASRRPKVKKDKHFDPFKPTNITGNVTIFSPPGVSSGFSKYGINYYGGPVMGSVPKINFIWYGQWTATGKQIIRDMVAGLSNSDINSVSTTYGDSKAVYVRKQMTLGLEATYTTYPFGTALSFSAVQQLVWKSLQGGGGTLPVSENDIYVVLSGPDVSQSDPGFAFCQQFCGWHTYSMFSNGAKFKFAWIGNAAKQCPGACGVNTISPNGEPGVDAMSSVVAHEIWETMSDPEISAWFDAFGWENADKCAWNFLTTQKATNGAWYNVQLGARKFLIQSNWVNHDGGYCSLSGTTFSTAWGDAVNTLYLANHAASCPPSAAMQRFQVQTTKVGTVFKLRVNSACPPLLPSVIGTPSRYATANNADGAGSSIYLDRHPVACPTGRVLQKWRLIRPVAKMMAIEYFCVPLTGTFTCNAVQYTAYADAGAGWVVYLDRHNLQCAAGKYLNSFKMTKSSTGQIRFEYKCCGV